MRTQVNQTEIEIIQEGATPCVTERREDRLMKRIVILISVCALLLMILFASTSCVRLVENETIQDHNDEESKVEEELPNVEDQEKEPDVLESFQVVFVGWDGTKLKTQTVTSGSSATAPEAPARSQYRFIGWDKAFSSIFEDTIVTAQYVQQFTVRFVDGATGRELKRQVVDAGTDATPPTAPEIEGYVFQEWVGDYRNVTEDLTIQAKYSAVYTGTYTVTFYSYDRTVLKRESVREGEAATPPAVPAKEGYCFIGWNTSFDCVKENIAVTALYDKITDPIPVTVDKSKPGKITLTFSLMQNPGKLLPIMGFQFRVRFDDGFVVQNIEGGPGVSTALHEEKQYITTAYINLSGEVIPEKLDFIKITFTLSDEIKDGATVFVDPQYILDSYGNDITSAITFTSAYVYHK